MNLPPGVTDAMIDRAAPWFDDPDRDYEPPCSCHGGPIEECPVPLQTRDAWTCGQEYAATRGLDEAGLDELRAVRGFVFGSTTPHLWPDLTIAEARDAFVAGAESWVQGRVPALLARLRASLANANNSGWPHKPEEE